MRQGIHRLTFVTDAPHFGGAERYILSMAQAARRRGIRPHVHWLPPADGDADVFAAHRIGDVPFTITPPEHHGSPWGLVRSFRAMLREVRPDGLVINACGRPRFWMLPWLARQAGTACAWVHQMVDARDPRSLEPKWLGGRMEGPQWWRVPQAVRHMLASLAATRVITLNDEDRLRVNRWQRVRPDRIEVVPHGVDVAWFAYRPDDRTRLREAWGIGNGPAPQLSLDPERSAGSRFHNGGSAGRGPFVFGTAGRLAAEKRVDLLIEATSLLVGRGLNVRCVIAGQGPEQERLVRLVRARNLFEHVRLVDFMEDMRAFHSALDAFVLCSATESFGLVLAEAMACRRAVVATPTSGARRQIEHGRTGRLLAGWSAAELADELALLAADPAERERLGDAGREHVSARFSIDLTLERTLRALQRGSRAEAGMPAAAAPDAMGAGLMTEDAA